MIAAFVLLLAFQEDPRIEQVERLLGNVNRPLLWMPLKVTLSSASGFSGDVVAKSGFGFSVARSVTIPAGGREVVLLPALRPSEVTAGKSRAEIPRTTSNPDRIVVLDSRLSYVEELASTEKVQYLKLDPKDLEATLGRGLLEAADLVLVKEPLGGALAAPTRQEADRAVAALGEHPPSVELVDRSIWTIAPRGGWVPAKRDWLLYFATVYAFAAFVALTVVARRFPKFGLIAFAAVAMLGIAGYGIFFPQGQMWIVGQAVEWVPPSGDAREHRYWFLQSAAPADPARIGFPRLVKPVFPSMAGAEEPFVIRVDREGCAIEGLHVGPDRPSCFGGEKGRAPSMRALDKLARPLRDAVLVRGGKSRFLGPLAAGEAVPAGAGEGSRPATAAFEAWKRFAGGDGLFGVSVGRDEPARDVNSTDLADEHERPPIFVQRLP